MLSLSVDNLAERVPEAKLLETWNADAITSRYYSRELVPMLRVGMPSLTLGVVLASAFPREREVRFQKVISSLFLASVLVKESE